LRDRNSLVTFSNIFMTTRQLPNLNLEEALKILKEYSCVQIKNPESVVDKEQLKQALILIISLSESENFGICADDAQEGLAALFDYLKATGYETNVDRASASEIEGGVYIKFNTQKMSYYLDSYTGNYRGVLVSCQSENDTIVGTYGHFPLDLFSNS
jgi:hypothetical protein